MEKRHSNNSVMRVDYALSPIKIGDVTEKLAQQGKVVRDTTPLRNAGAEQLLDLRTKLDTIG